MNVIPAKAQEVLEFWFGTEGAVRPEWFRKDPAFDAEILRRFGPLIDEAVAGGLADWQFDAHSALAQIVLLDQFTRNTRRNRADAFAGDTLALATARQMVASGQDLSLTPVQRCFVYLPFEHSEDLKAQDESIRLFTALSAHAPNQMDLLDYARRHHVIVERFGRFPHRNAALGRESTPEEMEFLKQPRSGF
jgi:uncharacterized protein (DUF924 family)